MANFIFFFQLQLRHGLAKLRDEKNGVVAEALSAPGLISNQAGTYAVKKLNFTFKGSDSDNAAETGGALPGGDIFEPGEEEIDPVLIRGAGAGVTGGKRAGGAA